jgi:hypothetical protein
VQPRIYSAAPVDKIGMNRELFLGISDVKKGGKDLVCLSKHPPQVGVSNLHCFGNYANFKEVFHSSNELSTVFRDLSTVLEDNSAAG